MSNVPENYIAIHTSDRIDFRRCRRKWFLGSELQRHLALRGGLNVNMWYGSGFHFALEDYHGYNRFKDPAKAFYAYLDVWEKKVELSPEALLLADLSPGMFNHYTQEWLPRRREYRTLWVAGQPQVEVEFRIYIPELSKYAGVPVYYVGTFDRVVEDNMDMLYIDEYKTAAKFDTAKLDTDPQISNYCWAGQIVYDRPIQGVVFKQFVKAVPKKPRVLKNGDISSAADQKTTYALYLKVLQSRYGVNAEFPKKNRDFLDILSTADTPEGDNFIRQDVVLRNEFSRDMEYKKILAEGYDMLNPKLNCYPSPTRDCYWDCTFRPVCLMIDDGSAWEEMLLQEYTKNEGRDETWREQIKWPIE